MADGARFDPRYDPAFQRGYAGGESAVPRPVESDGRASDAGPTVRSAPAPYSPAPVRPVPDAAPAHASAEAPASPDAPAEPIARDLEPRVPRDPRRNPFLIAVTALGVACLLLGAFWLSRIQQFFEVGAQTGGDFWIVMVSLVGAPLLMTLGVAVLAGVLFFLARHWQRVG